MKKIFVSGSFLSQERLYPYRQRLQDLGYQVRPRGMWPDEQEESRDCAQRDFEDIQTANLFVLDTLEGLRSYRYVEFGIGLGCGILCYVVGPCENRYLLLCTQQFDTWEEFFEFLRILGLDQ